REDLLNGTTAELGRRLAKMSDEWLQYNNNLAINATHAVVEVVNSSRWKFILASVVAIVLTGLLGFLTSRSIVKPVHALEASVKTIAAGDYTREVPCTKSTDETGGLARSIDVLKQGAAAMDQQRWVKANSSKLAGELQGASSLAAFGQRLLSNLVPML